MPLFDYTCRHCSQTFELLIRGSTAPECPNCGGMELHKHVSAPTPPGKSRAIMAAARAQATREGHACNHKCVNGKIVD